MRDAASFAGLKITVFIPQTDCSLAKGVWLQFQPAGNQAVLNLLHQLPPTDRRWYGEHALWWVSAAGIETLAEAIPLVATHLEQTYEDFLRRRRMRARKQQEQRARVRDQHRLYQMLRDWMLAAEHQQAYQQQQTAARPPTAPMPSLPDCIVDAFAVLELPTSASLHDIQAARRRLARQHHPDIAGGDTARMQRINNAADTCISWLSQASRR